MIVSYVCVCVLLMLETLRDTVVCTVLLPCRVQVRLSPAFVVLY